VTIAAPDVLIDSGGRLPSGAFTLGASRPALVLETNGRAVTVSTLTGSVECQRIDAYGDVSGPVSTLAPGSPLAVGAGERWRLQFVGDAGDGSTLAFA
jgi:hypothetical protein